MTEFLNIFIVPVISLSVYSRRFNSPLKFDCANLVRYCCLTVIDFIMTFLFMKALEAVTGIGAFPSSQFYTIVAVIVAFLLPYVYEIYKKYIDIRCEIKEKRKEK